MFGEKSQPPKRPKFEQLILVLVAIAIAALLTVAYAVLLRFSEMVAGQQ